MDMSALMDASGVAFPWRTPGSGGERQRGSVRELEDDGFAPSPTAPFSDVLGPDGRPVLPELGAQDPFVLRVNLDRLRARDPSFDQAALARRAADAMVTVETAWSALDPQPSRGVLAPALWSSHRARMELYRLHGRRNVVDHLEVHGARVVAVEQQAGRDRVTVRIEASSTDYDVDACGAVVRGDRSVRTWREDWILERSDTATSRADGGLLGRHCPACGAPLALDGDGMCSYCHAVPTDAQRDWVVTGVSDVRRAEEVLRAVIGVRTRVRTGPDDVSPTDEVVALDPRLAAGPSAPAPDPLAALRAADPAVDATGVTAAARSAFVAVCAAWRAMDSAPARPVLSEQGVHELDAAITALRQRGCRRVMDDPVVDAVTVRSATDGAQWETVTVTVVTLVSDADLDASGTVVRGDTQPRRFATELVLRRRRPGSGSGVDTCPRCGAPLRASVDGVCDYCRAAIAGGGGDWILDTPPQLRLATPAAQPVVAPAAATPSPLDALRAHDPSLNDAELLARARECFYTVETALARGDMSPASQCTTPRLLARLGAAVEQQHRAHQHRVLAFIDIAAARITAAVRGPDGDAVTVRLDVTGEDCVVDDTAGAVVSGTTAQRRWTEDWTLVRGAQGAAATWLADAVAGVP